MQRITQLERNDKQLNMNALEQYRWANHRRSFIYQSTTGMGAMALASLLNPAAFGGRVSREQGQGEQDTSSVPGAMKHFHFAPKAKRIIHLCMAGGPSHLETFDFKPALVSLHGKPFPESFTRGQQLARASRHRIAGDDPAHGRSSDVPPR